MVHCSGSGAVDVLLGWPLDPHVCARDTRRMPDRELDLVLRAALPYPTLGAGDRHVARRFHRPGTKTTRTLSIIAGILIVVIGRSLRLVVVVALLSADRPACACWCCTHAATSGADFSRCPSPTAHGHRSRRDRLCPSADPHHGARLTRHRHATTERPYAVPRGADPPGSNHKVIETWCSRATPPMPPCTRSGFYNSAALAQAPVIFAHDLGPEKEQPVDPAASPGREVWLVSVSSLHIAVDPYLR